MIDLTSFQQLIVLDVAIRQRQGGNPPHGLAIKDDLTQMYREVGNLGPEEEVNHGRLYPNLDELVDEGYLEKRTRDKRTNEYLLTDSGKEHIGDFELLVRVALGKEETNPYGPIAKAVAAGD